MADITRSEIIQRLLNVRSYTAEDLGADGFRCAGERSSRPVVLVGLDTLTAIIEFLAEDNQREKNRVDVNAEIARQLKIVRERLDDLDHSG